MAEKVEMNETQCLGRLGLARVSIGPSEDSQQEVLMELGSASPGVGCPAQGQNVDCMCGLLS